MAPVSFSPPVLLFSLSLLLPHFHSRSSRDSRRVYFESLDVFNRRNPKLSDRAPSFLVENRTTSARGRNQDGCTRFPGSRRDLITEEAVSLWLLMRAVRSSRASRLFPISVGGVAGERDWPGRL